VAELTLHLERWLQAPRPLVFDACTQPALLAEWWGPKDFTAPSLELDLEIEPPSRLAYTFRWEEPDPDDQETVVTISLRKAAGDSTELVLDQGLFATQARLTSTARVGPTASSG
jgi:uncharacterized protein YndB with AHSA1/START domain